MNRHGSIERAEKLIFKKWSSILPVLMLIMAVHMVNIWWKMNSLGEPDFLGSVVFDFITFPIFYIGVTNFVVRLINDEEANVYSVFEVLVKNPLQCYVLSFCYVAITSTTAVLVNYVGFGEANLWNGVAIIINCFLTVKFVLAIYIFCQSYESNAVACLERAWVRSKGFGLELLKIYLTVLVAGMLFTMGVGIIAGFVSSLLGMIGIYVSTGLVEFVSAFMMALVVMFENAAFSYLAVDICSGSIEPERFFTFLEGKGRDKLMVELCIVLSIALIAGSVTIWSPYIRYVKVEDSASESLFGRGEYEYKAPRGTKSINLAILALNEEGSWDTIESMEQRISERQRKGSFNVTFNYDDGFYEFNIDTDGENYSKKGSDERLKFEALDYRASSYVRKRFVRIDDFEVLGKCYKDDNQGVRDYDLDDLSDFDGAICAVVSFGD